MQSVTVYKNNKVLNNNLIKKKKKQQIKRLRKYLIKYVYK